MRPIKTGSVDNLNITVTATSTSLGVLMRTAGSTTAIFDGNTVVIMPEDGDIRIAYENAPTATKGFLISSGSPYEVEMVDLESLNLIRTSGDVAVSLFLSKEIN